MTVPGKMVFAWIVYFVANGVEVAVLEIVSPACTLVCTNDWKMLNCIISPCHDDHDTRTAIAAPASSCTAAPAASACAVSTVSALTAHPRVG
jgi:hypothetical protein